MNVDIQNPDHVITMISGFEALSLRDYQNPDAQYANTVLKMNGCDLSAIAGQEGFLSAIKEGGKKFIEMIWNFLKKVKEFFFGSRGTKSENVIKELGKVTVDNVKLIKGTPTERLDSVLEGGKDQITRLEKIMSGQWGGVNFKAHGEFLKSIKDLREVTMREHDISGLSITHLPPTDYKTHELIEAFELVNEIISDYATGNKEGIEILKNIGDAEKLTNALKELRYAALYTVFAVDKDLVIATKDLEQTGKTMGKDESLAKQYKHLESFVRVITRADAQLVKLTSDVEKYLVTLETTTSSIVKKIDPDNFKDLRKFEEFMNSEQNFNI